MEKEKCKNCLSYHVGWAGKVGDKDGEKLICCSYYLDNNDTRDVFEIIETFKCPIEIYGTPTGR